MGGRDGSGASDGGMGMRSSTKAGSIGSAIGPALGKDGSSLSQDLGGCAPTATSPVLGHRCLCGGPGHGKRSIVAVAVFLTKYTNKLLDLQLGVDTLVPGCVNAFFGCWSPARKRRSERRDQGDGLHGAGSGTMAKARTGKVPMPSTLRARRGSGSPGPAIVPGPSDVPPPGCPRPAGPSGPVGPHHQCHRC